MEYLILIPMKKTYEVDLVKYLKVAISSQSGTFDDKVKESAENLNRMRNNTTSKTIDTRQEHSLEMIEKYYDQICLLNSKLPQADIPFKWKDAFEKGGYLFSSGYLTISNMGYEKVCVLFNIGALMSNLGAYYGKEGSFNDDSLKQAIKHFQGAAGIFQALKHTTSSSANTSELSFDLQSDVLNLLQHIMLAQAQETFFFKASNDKMKDQSIARIAAQCEEFYGEVYKQIQAINCNNKQNIAEWVDVFSMKQQAYRGLAEYYQSLVSKQRKEFGEQITRLSKAIEFLKLAESKSSVVPLSSKFKDYLNKATQSLEEVQKDNDFIYHEKIPEYKTLQQISKAILAKPTDLPHMFYPSETDMFPSLLPFGVQQSIQKLEQRQGELVNNEIATLREATQTLNAVLASLNLPAAIEDLKGAEVPKSLQQKSAVIKQKGGVEELDKLLSELPDLLQRNKEILDEIERSLQAEEETDTNMKSQFKEKWTRTPSAKLNQAWRDQISKYRNIVKNAVDADNKIKTKYNDNIGKIRLLSNSSESALAAAIPASNSNSANYDESNVNKLRQLMTQVDALKKGRENLESDIKNVGLEEIKAKFMNSLNLHTDVNESNLSAETMAQFYGDLQKRIRDNLEKQEGLLEEIRSANEAFTSQKGSSENKRDQFMRELASASDAYMELLSNLNEGTKFYNDLTQVLVNLQVKVNDFCFARKAEREELCKDLQNEIVSRPNPPVIAAPNYHDKTEENKPVRPPPPTVSTAPPTQNPYSYPAPTTAPYPYPPQQVYQPGYNYYPPPPMPSGFNPYMPPQAPGNPYYPQQNYQYPPGYPYQQPPQQ